MSTPQMLRHGLAMAAATTMILAGCSSGGESESGASGSDGADGGGGEVAITFRTWLPTQVQWPELVAAFEEENPGITIDFQRDEDYDTYKTNLDNDILADEVPDVYGIQGGASFDDYAEFALPVDDYAGSWIDEIDENSRSQTTTTDGTEAAVPILTAGMEFYLYNKTLWDELGLELPQTHEDLVEVAGTAREAGYSPFAMGAADAWHNSDFFVWLSTQYGDGEDVYKAARGEGQWDTENLVAAATAWQKLFTDGVFQDAATTTTTYPSARDDFFLARKAIAMPTGSWHVGMALEGPDQEQPGTEAENDEIGMAAFPTLGDSEAGATVGVDFALAVGDTGDEATQEAAAKFVEFMATGTGQQLWVNTLQGFPVAQDVQIEVADDEPELGKESVQLVTDALHSGTHPRKLLGATSASLEDDLGAVLQSIAEGADPSTELATLNG